MFCKLTSGTPLKDRTKRKNVYIVKVFRIRLETLILVRKRYISMPRAGRSGVLLPVETTDFPLLQNVQTGSAAQQAFYSTDKG